MAYLNFFFFFPRFLEEGNVDGAEEQKQRIEQLQRERRKVLQDNNMTHKPRFFKYATCLCSPSNLMNLILCWLLNCCVCRKSNNDTWVSNNTYWDLRREPGFSKIDFPVLWWPRELTRSLNDGRIEGSSQLNWDDRVFWLFERKCHSKLTVKTSCFFFCGKSRACRSCRRFPSFFMTIFLNEMTFSALTIRFCHVASRYLQRCLSLPCLTLSAAVALLEGLKPFVLPFPFFLENDCY